MTIAEWCLLFMGLMLVLSKAPVAKAQNDTGRYDNNHPRAQQVGLTGWGARALAAHQNHFEAFPLFAAGVLVAERVSSSPAISLLAVLFVIARVAYTALYIANIGTLRSVVWGVGYLSSLALLAAPLWATAPVP